MKSLHAVILVSLIWFGLGTIYYPKWDKGWSEAAISWDVSGYYHYLPAIWIYKDIRQQTWMDAINEKYLPSPAYDQAFVHEASGHKVNKYAIGQAVLFSPFFLAAHAYASWDATYPADGYSKPYQVAVWFGSLLASVLGLILLRRILLHYAEDKIVAFTLLGLGLGTNWMEYAAISNGMNHTWLFTLLCGLIFFTIRFNARKDWTSALGIGAMLGLAILTRPTEIIWVAVPMLWGSTTVKERISFLLLHWKKGVAAVIVCGLIIGIELVYWKYASGEWIVYSYRDQGFNWFTPKIRRGLIGPNIGWWTYTPLMLIAMFGWGSLFKTLRQVFWPTVILSFLGIYLTLAWGHFESGGGLGQRNLIQYYPVLAFPLMMVIRLLCKTTAGSWIWYALLALNVYYSGWWVHQAHKGGFFHPGHMTSRYIYQVAGRLHPDKDLFKLLDTREYFYGMPRDIQLRMQNDFEQDTAFCTADWPSGGKAKCLNAENQFYGPVHLPVDGSCGDWIRLEADFLIQSHEWDAWKKAQWIVKFYQGGQEVKSSFIRIQRLISEDQVPTPIFFDVKIPDKPFDSCTMMIWNAGSLNALLFDNFKVSCFRSK